MTSIPAGARPLRAPVHPASGLRAATADEADVRARDDAFLLAWSDAVRFLADPREVLAETVARLGRRLGASRVNYAEADTASEALTVHGDWTDGARSTAGEIFPLAALGEAVVRDHLRGEPFVSVDMLTDPRVAPANRATYEAVQVRAALTVPLVKSGRLLAVLSVQQSTPRAWTPAEVRLTCEAAERTWAVIARARAEAELARSRERLHQAEKSAALGALLAGVSHELNNPLSIIAAQASLLQRRPEGPDVAARAGAITEAAGRCSRIVKTFLAIARQRDLAPAPTDLNAVASAALELSAADLRGADVRTERDLDSGLPLIPADGEQLRHALVELVANAVQALADAPEPRRLTVRTGAGDAGDVWLEIADTGRGVAPEHRGRIFEPFFTTRPQGAGMGVGLSLAQGLVEAHGGALTLVDATNGATFRLMLPADGGERRALL